MAVAYERPQSQSIPMVDCGMQRPVSALARGVQITELCDGSCMNPDPILLQDSPILRDQCLSPTQLQLLSGSERLENVSSLELKVDTSQSSLNNFGLLLPNLTILKLSGSYVPKIRDLGSSLQSVEVLWMRGCSLQELDGVCSMGRLRELYLAYNDIHDLAPLSLLDLLHSLDLEGNNVDDIDQLECLALCCKLQHLTLEGNPVCVAPRPDSMQDNYDYRQAVKRMLTGLATLDDKPLTGVDSGASSPHNIFDADWAFLEELQGDALLIESLENESETVSAAGRPTTAALTPATAYRPGSALKPASAARPLTSATRRPASISGGRPSSAWTDSAKPRPASSDGAEGVEAASDLTCGLVICGNPSKALRARRHREAATQGDTTPSFHAAGQSSAPKARGPSLLDLRPVPSAGRKEEEEEGGGEEEEEREGEGPVEDRDLSHLLQELRRLVKIRESKAAQVLRIEGREEEDEGLNLSPTEDTDVADRAIPHGHDSASRPTSSQRRTASHSSREGCVHPPVLSPDQEHRQNLFSGRPSSPRLRDVERSLSEDCGFLKDCRRLSVPGSPPGEAELVAGDPSSHLRELRGVRGGGHPPSGFRRIVVPSTSSARLPEPSPSPMPELSPRDRPRRVRIGPTGLPGSSHSKHAQIGDRLVAPPAPSLHPRPPLPPTTSQHRARRSLPEVATLPSRHTPLFRS
ncbi:uncharacterized protein LOC143286694 isoform X2 [Babylonia areolata]|uniref:uncharacterized protein LOC143286694 isoform X2 n=1 Tax=Babylonia areolata TaxID=304850 RepID=UPI003FD42EDC